MQLSLTSFLLLLFSINAFAGSVYINGKTYTCNGSISVSNDEVICNGKKLSSSENTGPCGGSQTRKHTNGGGQVDIQATVPPGARVSGTVCGSTTLDESSIVQQGAILSGNFKVRKSAVIKSGATVTGSGYIGEGVVIGEGATLSGNINIANGEISRGTTLSGNINIDGVTLSGNLTCAGNGTMSATPPPNSAR